MKINLILATCLFLSMISCSKDCHEETLGGTNDNIKKGNIIGNLKVYDQYGLYDMANSKDVKIFLNGTSPLVSVLTDTKGDFKFSNIPSSTLQIRIDPKQGYTAINTFTIDGIGEGITFSYSAGSLDYIIYDEFPTGYIPRMYEISKTNVNATIASGAPYIANLVYTPLVPDGKNVGLTIFLSNLNNVSNTQYLVKGTQYDSTSTYNVENIIGSSGQFPSGSIVYAKFYTGNLIGTRPNGSTLNINGASATLSFIAP